MKSIKDNHSDMQLNKYEKSKMIILYESGYDIRTPEGLKIYIQLLLSKSFFDECINTGIETLCDIAWEFYLCDKGFHIDQDVKQNLNECYTTLRKRDPNFKMSEEEFKKTIEEIFFKVCEEMFPGLSIGKPNKKTLEMKKLLKMIPEREKILESVLNACKERFSAWPKEASTETYIKGAEIIQHLETTDINENKISGNVLFQEILLKSIEETPLESSEEISLELPKELIIEALMYDVETKKFMETLYEDIEIHRKIGNTIPLMMRQLFRFVVTRFDLLFDHYLYQDISFRFVSNDELEFAKKIKKNDEEYQKKIGEIEEDFEEFKRKIIENFETFMMRISKMSKDEYDKLEKDPHAEISTLLISTFDDENAHKRMILSDLEQASKIIFKYKQPSIFSENYNTSDDVYQCLVDFFGANTSSNSLIESR